MRHFAGSSAFGNAALSRTFAPPSALFGCGRHREVHRCGDEAAWWTGAGVDAIGIARKLWTEKHPIFAPANDTSADVAIPTIAARKQLDKLHSSSADLTPPLSMIG
jgi:hypothetical protein